MLKTTRLSNLSAFKKNKSNNKIIKFSINNNNIKFVKKLEKLKNQNLSKF